MGNAFSSEAKLACEAHTPGELLDLLGTLYLFCKYAPPPQLCACKHYYMRRAMIYVTPIRQSCLKHIASSCSPDSGALHCCRKHEGRTPTIVGYDLSELEHWGVSQAERDALEGGPSFIEDDPWAVGQLTRC